MLPLARRLEAFRENLQLAASISHAARTGSIVQRFLWGAEIRRTDQLTPAAVSRYLLALQADGRSPKTLQNHLHAISRFCRYLRGLGIPVPNPGRDVILRQPHETPPRYLTDADVRTALLLARQHRIWPEVCLALSTGLRLSEMVRLQWADIDLPGRVLIVRVSKSGRWRAVPLSRPAVTALRIQRWKFGRRAFVFPARQTWPGAFRYVDRPRNTSWWLRALRPIQEAIPSFRTLPGRSTGRGWHLLRHTFASRAAQAGVSLYKLASWLGHSDVRTTQIYAHLQPGFDPEIERAAPIREGKE